MRCLETRERQRCFEKTMQFDVFSCGSSKSGDPSMLYVLLRLRVQVLVATTLDLGEYA